MHYLFIILVIFSIMNHGNPLKCATYSRGIKTLRTQSKGVETLQTQRFCRAWPEAALALISQR